MHRARQALTRVLATILIAALAISPASADGLRDTMDDMFGSMVSSAPPGAFETQRRGVISGGHFAVKNRIITARLIAFQPPSFTAGCGGVDLFGGSFSFINAEAFVELLRGVAANGVGVVSGYAFQLALKAMCESCAQTIDTLQKKIQELNQMFQNSCQLAKGIVKDTDQAIRGAQDSEQSQWSTFKGFSDVFGSWTASGGQGPAERIYTSDPQKWQESFRGNLMWRAMHESGIAGWFTHSDTVMMEAIMNLTGTIILGDLKDSSSGSGQSQEEKTALSTITLQHILNGEKENEITIYGCPAGKTGKDECFPLIEKKLGIDGFETRLRAALLGTGGLVAKLSALNPGDTVSEADKKILASMVGTSGAMLVNLTDKSKNSAEEFALKVIPHMAYEMADIVLADMFRAAEFSVTASKHPRAKVIQDRVAELRKELRDQLLVKREEIGTYDSIIAYYTNALESARKNKGVVGTVASPGKD